MDDLKKSLADLSQSDISQELRESIDQLNEALKASESNPPTQGSVLQVKDLSELAAKHLTPSAKYDLSQKATSLIVKYDDGRCYASMYFATRVRTGDEDIAVEYLCRILNDLSQRGLIHSTLAPLSSLELARTSSVAESVVFCFVLIPATAHKDIESLYPKFVIKEGEVGEPLYDLSVPLSEGEFLTTIRLSHNLLMQGSANYQERFQTELNQYLAMLPKGTRVRQVTQLAIQDLSVQFEVKFHNRLLQRVKRVELEYVREIAQFDNRIEQFNVVTGIRYFDAEDKELYR